LPFKPRFVPDSRKTTNSHISQKSLASPTALRLLLLPKGRLWWAMGIAQLAEKRHCSVYPSNDTPSVG
jgi:hypothetical protein